MLPLVTALCLLALTSASPIVNADPKPCCIPEVFEGSVTGLQAQYINGAPSISLTEASIHMDMKNERIAQQHTFNVEGSILVQHIIDRGSDNSTYIFTPQLKVCYKMPYLGVSNCLSSDMTYATSLKVGINPSLDVDVYTRSRGLQKAMLAVTKENCVPISMNVGLVYGEGLIAHTDRYHSMALGIKDTSVFDVPSYCQDAENQPLTGSAQKAFNTYLEWRALFQ